MGKSCFVRESPHQLAQFGGHIDDEAEAHWSFFNQIYCDNLYIHQEEGH